EPGDVAADRDRLVEVVGRVEEVAEGLILLDDAARAMRRDAFVTQLAPDLAALTRAAVEGLDGAASLVEGSPPEAPPDLDSARRTLDARFVALSEVGVSRTFAPREVMRFCTFLVPLRSVAADWASLRGTVTAVGTDRVSFGGRPTGTQLVGVYRKTDYRVVGPRGRFVLQVDRASPELDVLLTRHRVLSWA